MKILQTLITTVIVAVVIAGCGNGDSASAQQAKGQKVLLNKDSPEMKQQAPATYQARFETNKGAFVIDVERKLSPNGADRFYNLVRNGYYDGNKFFRVVPGFILQWGMHGDPAINKIWSESRIMDDPVLMSNKKGTITFAKPGAPNARSTHLFINFKDNTNLDRQGFAAFGHVSAGMEVVEAINAEYGQSPDQGQIGELGNAYLNERFPNLDTILSAKIVD
ncbi:MAG: peptidylprolyl isomerase [bacterium]|nr:peptidylprolyl isomerase [bacterium]